MGDERTYQRPIILRAVESSDAMTADWAKLPTTCWRGSPATSWPRSPAPTASARHHVQAARDDRVGVFHTKVCYLLGCLAVSQGTSFIAGFRIYGASHRATNCLIRENNASAYRLSSIGAPPQHWFYSTGDHRFPLSQLRDRQFFSEYPILTHRPSLSPLWLFTWSFGYSSTTSDGSPYEKRVDAKGRVLSDERIAGEVPFEELPEGWVWARLAGVASIQLGKMLDKQKNEGEPVPYLGNANVQWGEFDLANIKTMRMNEADRAKFALANGDLIVCEGGVPGRCAIWTSNKTMYYQKALHRVRCDKRLLLNTYCELYIRLIVQSHIWDGCLRGQQLSTFPRKRCQAGFCPSRPWPNSAASSSV